MYVQIGQMAMRSPSGEMLPAVPLYDKKQPVKRNKASGLTPQEEKILNDFAEAYGEIYKYQQERDAALRKKDSTNSPK